MGATRLPLKIAPLSAAPCKGTVYQIKSFLQNHFLILCKDMMHAAHPLRHLSVGCEQHVSIILWILLCVACSHKLTPFGSVKLFWSLCLQPYSSAAKSARKWQQTCGGENMERKRCLLSIWIGCHSLPIVLTLYISTWPLRSPQAPTGFPFLPKRHIESSTPILLHP